MKKIFLILCSVLLMSSMAWADQNQIIGKLVIDNMIKNSGSTLTVVFNIENYTDAFWTIPWEPGYAYTYVILNTKDVNTGISGKLPYSNVPYVGPNSTAAFGIGTIPLIDKNKKPLKPGTYRIFISATQFGKVKDGVKLGTVNISAEAAFRITNP
ncbi:MAG: hypothetical protein HQL26_03640 [Candidatus Omnitrophica bacterium]|nr:hypothetical protein [Candidatus Omnitrophota bacterium]